MQRTVLSFLVNTCLLFSGFVVAFSDMLMQVQYHIGNHKGINDNNIVLGTTYSEWSLIHKISASVLFFFIICHVVLHKKWYKIVITKRLMVKNKEVISLTIIVVLAATLGYIPWLIDIAGGDIPMRKVFVEIHDKIALALIIYLVLHIVKRLKWFIITFEKLRN